MNGSFSAVPMISGTAITPAYMLMTCCRPNTNIRPGGSTSLTGWASPASRRAGFLTRVPAGGLTGASPALARVERGRAGIGCVVAPDGSLDEPVGPVVGVEHLVLVLQAERAEVEEEMVLVGQ